MTNKRLRKLHKLLFKMLRTGGLSFQDEDNIINAIGTVAARVAKANHDNHPQPSASDIPF